MFKTLFDEWNKIIDKKLTDVDKHNIKSQYEQLFNGKVIDVKNNGTVDMRIQDTIYKGLYISAIDTSCAVIDTSCAIMSKNCSVTFNYDYRIEK